MMKAWALCLMCLLPLSRALGAPGDATGQAQAQEHYQKGVAAYEAGRYATARDEFDEAYRLSHLPDLLINLAAASESLDHPEEAIRYLRSYLQERPEAPDRNEVTSQIERLRQKLPPETVPATPKPPPAPVQPAQPVRQAPPPARRGPRAPWAAVGLVIGGGVVLLAGIGAGSAALLTAQALQSAPRFDRDLYHRGMALDTAAITCDVIGGAALVAGLAWTTTWYVHRGRERAPVRASLSPQGAGLLVSARY